MTPTQTVPKIWITPGQAKSISSLYRLARRGKWVPGSIRGKAVNVGWVQDGGYYYRRIPERW